MKTGPSETPFMTAAQLKTELLRCEYCEEKPCRDACPAHCSPADFIMAARLGTPADLRRAAGEIMSKNPLGGCCGQVCPDWFCMAACSRKEFDGAINIPAVQAAIVHQAKQQGGIPAFAKAPANGKKVAVVGGGPGGLGAAAALAQMGYEVDILESRAELGGMCNLIPEWRLSRQVLKTDIEFALSLGNVHAKTGVEVKDPKALLAQGYAAVVVAAGLWKPMALGFPNEQLALSMVDVLSAPQKHTFTGRVAVLGGGATALDCALTALARGARSVEMFSRRTLPELTLSASERAEILSPGIEFSGRIRVMGIRVTDGKVTGLDTRRLELRGEKFSSKDIFEVPGSDQAREGFTAVISAMGMHPVTPKETVAGLFYAGDLAVGPSTVVESVASGKNAAAELDAWVRKQPAPVVKKASKSTVTLAGYRPMPVSLEAEFFGRPIRSPYLLSAAPPTDGYDQMKLAYQHGWAGGVLKTAFDGVPIHIPAEYMHAFTDTTYGNCDNVSGHALDRVRREIETLVKEWPDRLTIGSTGGPVTGKEDFDRAGWQSNTRKLDSCGAMAVEYSLSCPQGGDGSEGDIVSQNAALTAKVVDWVMEASDPNVPKLFKLTAAVTSIVPILKAIRGVLAKYPHKKGGVTLANSFPTLCLRPGRRKEWEEGIVVGMSGEGVTPISYLTLANAVPLGVEISGNGGPMNYKAAADFLALGVKTVQFCTVVMKYGLGIVNELEQGTAFLMQERGIRSVKELIGRAQPKPVTDFMALPATKKLSVSDHATCTRCGNCARCPYLAIKLNDNGYPRTDPALCIGCSICAQKCFTGSITMRERTAQELAVMHEA